MFIEPIAEATAEEPLRDYYERQRRSWGFLPNYAGAFSTRPDVAQAWDALNGAVRSGMERRRFEIATVAAARALRSTYCTAAHSLFLREVCEDEEAVQAIVDDPTGAGLAGPDRAVYELATKVATDASSIEQADVDAARRAGLSDADVADVVFAAAARSFFTKVLDGLGAQLDVQTASSFPPGQREAMVVGRPAAAE